MELIENDFLGTKIDKTLVYALNCIEEVPFHYDKELICDFIDCYLPAYREILIPYYENGMNNVNFTDIKKECYVKEILEEKYELENGELFRRFFQELGKEFQEIEILEDEYELKKREWFEDFFQERYNNHHCSEFMNSSAYNVCNVLIGMKTISEDLDSLELAIEEGDYSKGLKNCQNMLMTLKHVNLALSDFIMEDYLGKNFDYSRHFMPSPRIGEIPHNLRGLLYCYEYLKQIKQFVNPLLLLYFEMSRETIESKLNYLKLQLALCCIKRSPQYSICERRLAKQIIDILLDFLFDCNIHKVFINSNKFFDATVPVEKRGSRNETTRLQVFFSISNEDIFCLRIDLPHKGEEYLHLNLEEGIGDKVKSIGIPLQLTGVNKSMLWKLCGENYGKLFFDYENLIWFRSDFLCLLDKWIEDEENKKMIKKLYRHQCHLKIYVQGVKEQDSVRVLNELNDYLIKFKVHQLTGKRLTKETVNTSLEISRIRKFIKQYNFVDKMLEVGEQEKYEYLEEYYKKKRNMQFSVDTMEEILRSEWYEILFA